MSLNDVTGTGTVTGWGMSENPSPKLNDMLSSKLEIPVINSAYCFKTFPILATLSSNRTFCGGYEKQKKLPCLGDLGGGFYRRDVTTWSVKGIISSPVLQGIGCDTDKFTVYTNVARYVDWIKDMMV